MIDAAKKAEGIEPYVSQAGPNGGVDDGEDLRAGGPVSEGDPWRDGMVAQVAGLMEQVVDLDAKAAAGADTVLAELFEPLANNSTDAAIELFGVYSRSDASGRSAIAEVFHALTGETFDSFLMEASRTCEETLEAYRGNSLPGPDAMAVAAKKAAGAKVSAGVDGGGKHI